MWVVSEPTYRTPGAGGRFHRVRVEALGGQDRPLVLRPAQRVLADAAVRPDDAVAGHDQRDRVVAEGRAHGPDRLRAPDLGGDPAVRPDLAARDLEGLVPDVPLEVGVAAQVEVDPDAPVAVEPPGDGAGRDASGSRSAAMGRAAGPRDVVGLERGVVRGRLDGRHAQPVPGHDERPDRRVEPGVQVGQPDLAEDVRGQGRRCPGQQGGHGGLDVTIGGHAVISSRSRRWAASNAVRNRARPRWTWALTVPSGRSRAAASSG